MGESMKGPGGGAAVYFRLLTRRRHRLARLPGKGVLPAHDHHDLQRQGVRTIIDLEDDASAESAERSYAARLGLAWISEPMNASANPSDSEMNQILALLQDSRRYPIFVHCKYGEDRTGLIIALHRVFSQGWTPKAAHDEMMDLGYDPFLVAMNKYFENKTGWDD